jgi:hypothetical protein
MILMMKRRLTRSLCLGLCAALLAAAPAAAGDDEVRRRGDCSGGEGDWDLRVKRIDRNTLEVRFKIDDVDSGERWQLFLSNNGDRVYSDTKVSNSEGEVRIRKRIRNRAGTDRIAASGLNESDGTTCQGSVSF